MSVAVLGSVSLDMDAYAVTGFTVERAITVRGTGDITLATAGDLTFGGTIGACNITLPSGGNFANTAGANALQAWDRWLVWSQSPDRDRCGGLMPNFIQYAARYGQTALAQASGNAFLYTR